ncbi:Protoheme IX farnesyltransferase, mitochondrial [Steccherinum ochraceum]|uniref:Protoheme IX farnesyltransferase, mitochondrial n=1 Tax=Steccherinum ochraceum TaxID=92696 RepID=A0A4R0R5W6_9APHY|nr:Protoheme IX farnesyltransferase, mitochondrial [Steccherinum ochraceum]
MQSAPQFLGSYACRRCTANIASTSARRCLARSASTYTRPKSVAFASYFFHNSRWTSYASPGRLPVPSPVPARRVAQVAGQDDISYTSSITTPPIAWRRSEVLTPRRLFKVYAQLAKSRLTVLVVLTAMGGVAMSPLPATASVLFFTTVGTTLCSVAANTINQIREVPYDAQMARTRNRPLVRKAITPTHAAGFAAVTGIAGPAILWTMVNPTTAILGALNIALYAGVYTSLKRTSIVNTWVGAVVGSLPPLMGWAACGGHILPSAEYPIHIFLPSFLSSVPVDLALVDNPLAPFAFFMVLYSWQFPHFNALSYLVRASYAQAGYKMLSVVNPAKNALVSLRHTLLLIPMCSVLVPLSGLTTWAFALTSLVPNAIWAHAAWKFWRHGSEKHARTTFHHSLWYMPVILGLMMFHKQGVDWTSWIWGKQEDEDE